MATKAMPKQSDSFGNTDAVESETDENSIRKQRRLIRNEINYLKSDIRANSMMNKGIDLAVGVMVVGLLAAFLLPIAINEIVGVDTSAWGSAETQLFNLLPIFFVLAILLYIVRRAK